MCSEVLNRLTSDNLIFVAVVILDLSSFLFSRCTLFHLLLVLYNIRSYLFSYLSVEDFSQCIILICPAVTQFYRSTFYILTGRK